MLMLRCPHCLRLPYTVDSPGAAVAVQALFWARTARAVAAAVSVVAAAASLAVALTRPFATQWQLPAALSAASVLAAWGWRYCNKWVGKFLYVDYDHQAKE